MNPAHTYNTIIIGGGAAGFAAASFMSAKTKKLIIEKNQTPMKKLAITGKGRCNLTNNCDIETVLCNIPKNSRFMQSSLAAFSSLDTMAFFDNSEPWGVSLKTERGGRVFPVSDKSSDILNVLKKACNAEVIAAQATELLIEDNVVKGVKCSGGGTYYAENVIVATGGMSYPNTGSTGDGYKFARQAGHTITPLKPALVPLETAEKCCCDMAGLSLKNVKLTLKRNNKPVYSEQGEMLFTHFGVSGPLVLTASCYMADDFAESNYTLSIDLKPALDEKTLDDRILRDFSKNKNKHLKNALSELLPQSMIPAFLERLGDSLSDKLVCEVSKEERRKLLMLFKDFSLTVTAFRPIAEAVITDGGVSVKELNPKTMESKLVKGLYFVGEVIDVMGFTGGFNLQIAFSTAYAAAVACDAVTGD